MFFQIVVVALSFVAGLLVGAILRRRNRSFFIERMNMSSPGPRAGKVIANLPVTDLLKKDGGAWNGKVNMRKSKLVKLTGEYAGKDAIHVQFDKNSGAPGGNFNGGLAVDFSPRGMRKDAVVLAMRVFYPIGFDFARGGKMIGIEMGEGESSGGRHSPNASSHRIMWQTDGGAISYIYPPEGVKQADSRLSTESFGVGAWKKDFERVLKTGKWHDVEVGVRMNTFDARGKPNPDGVGYIRIDGISREFTGIRWAGTKKYAYVSGLTVSSFFGGPLTSPKDQHAYYADFSVREWDDTRRSQVVSDHPSS